MSWSWSWWNYSNSAVFRNAKNCYEDAISSLSNNNIKLYARDIDGFKEAMDEIWQRGALPDFIKEITSLYKYRVIGLQWHEFQGEQAVLDRHVYGLEFNALDYILLIKGDEIFGDSTRSTFIPKWTQILESFQNFKKSKGYDSYFSGNIPHFKFYPDHAEDIHKRALEKLEKISVREKSPELLAALQKSTMMTSDSPHPEWDPTISDTQPSSTLAEEMLEAVTFGTTDSEPYGDPRKNQGSENSQTGIQTEKSTITTEQNSSVVSDTQPSSTLDKEASEAVTFSDTDPYRVYRENQGSENSQAGIQKNESTTKTDQKSSTVSNTRPSSTLDKEASEAVTFSDTDTEPYRGYRKNQASKNSQAGIQTNKSTTTTDQNSSAGIIKFVDDYDRNSSFVSSGDSNDFYRSNETTKYNTTLPHEITNDATVRNLTHQMASGNIIYYVAGGITVLIAGAVVIGKLTYSKYKNNKNYNAVLTDWSKDKNNENLSELISLNHN